MPHGSSARLMSTLMVVALLSASTIARAITPTVASRFRRLPWDTRARDFQQTSGSLLWQLNLTWSAESSCGV